MSLHKDKTSRPPTQQLRLLGRWIVRGVFSVVLLIVTLIAALYFTLDTQRGSDWLLSRSLSFVSPQATFSEYSGTLATGIQLKDLHLPLDSADISIASINSHWSLWGILGGEFLISKLHIDSLNIDIHAAPDSAKETSPPSPWPSLRLPIPVSLKDAKISGVTIRQGDSIQSIDAISLSAHSGLINTNIAKLEIKASEYSAKLSGKLNNRPPYQMRLNLDWSLRLPNQPVSSGAAKIKGDLAHLRLSHKLTRPSEIDGDIDISDWYEPSQASVDIEKIRLDANFDWQKLVLALPVNDPAKNSAEAHKNINLTSTEGQFRLQGTWQNYALNLHSQLVSTMPSENEKSSNNTSKTQSIVDGVLAKPADVELTLRGDKLAIVLSSFNLQTDAGKLSLAGEFNANALLSHPTQSQTEKVSWQLKLAADDVDTTSLTPDWPVKLSIDLSTTGYWQNQTYQAAINIATLSGHIADKTVSGSGTVTVNDKGQTFDKLNLQLGDNTLAADGKLLDKSEFNWVLNAPKLEQILPQLHGGISSTGMLKGSAITTFFDEGRSPEIKADVALSKLQYQNYSIAAAQIDLETDTAAAIKLDLESSGISASVLNNAALNLHANGSIQQHQLVIGLIDGDKHLDVAITGALQQTASKYRWLSTIKSLALDSAVSGPWQLEKDSKIDLGPNKVTLANFCLTQNDTRICGNANLDNGSIRADGHIDSFSLDRFAAGLPAGATLTGTLNSRFSISGKSDDLNGELGLGSGPIRIAYQANEEQDAIEYLATLSTKANIEHNKLKANALFNIDDVGSIKANINTSGLKASSELTGSINGGFSNLRWIGGLFPQLEKLDGELSANIITAGQISAPIADGKLSLSDVKMELPELGLSLKDANANINFDSRGPWQLNSHIRSGDGILAINGQGTLGGNAGVTGDIRISGENITALDRSDAFVLISPDISASLAPELIKIRGTLAIPKGNFTLKTLPEQAVGVSPDEQIVNSRVERNANPSRPIDTRVQITLNDSFAFKGYGLSTRLGGELKVTQKSDAATQAFGSLSLYDGVYEAYGQKLNVQRGLLIFQGPLDNPGLNITAVRETKSATVGVNIGGFAQDIRSELFSDPTLPPTDVMAILITGKAPSDMNKSDANQVMNAATALGISQSRGITNTLQNTFGVDVISLQGGDSYEDSSLVVGKYLTPELFISYVQNLFTPAGSVQLDYSLSKNLGLKAQSGKAQSIDLLYKVEHGEQ
jgi:translocation and assembly module TamB